jgi:hypothetical protein
MLKAKDWDGPPLGASMHFLSEHTRFDSDPETEHGALRRRMTGSCRSLG